MWRYVAASVQGASHLKANTPCQDYCTAIELHEANLLLLMCSDGAGSASRSELGSEISCRTLSDEIVRFAQRGGHTLDVARETALEWLQAVRLKLETQANAIGLMPRDLACTLVAALVDDHGAAFLQIGDGSVVVVSGDSEYDVIFWPEQGEYANTTFFVTGPDAEDRLRVEVRSSLIRDIALFTDGLQHIALRYQSKTAHPPFFAPMFARLRADEDWSGLGEPLKKFLGSEAVTKRTDDDCTLVLASRCDG